jgi:hypothetical protein
VRPDEPEGDLPAVTTCPHMVFLSRKQRPNDSWTLQRTMFMYAKEEINNKAIILEAC